MRRFFNVICCLLLAAMALSSCKGESSYTITLYNDAAITAFTLGSMKQYKPSTTEVIATITGSNYKMIIDQVGEVDDKGKRSFLISNPDSLPLGTDTKSVLCTVTSLNNGGIFIKNTADDQFTPFNSSNAIDLSVPRIFRVTSTDGSYVRDYTVQVNVKKSAEKSFAWIEKANIPMLNGHKHLRLLALSDMLFAVGVKGETTYLYRSVDGGNTWGELPWTQDVPLDTTAWENVVNKDDTMFMLNDGTLFRSDDGTQWDMVDVHSNYVLKVLFGTSSNELFALNSEEKIMTSFDNGEHWQEEKITADEYSMMPTKSIACTKFALNDSTDYVLMAGNNEFISAVWRKISSYNNPEQSGQWVNLNVGMERGNSLPLLDPLSLVYYDKRVLAFSKVSAAYCSQDQGITWPVNDIYQTPDELQSVAADIAGNLWAVSTNGTVFQGTKF